MKTIEDVKTDEENNAHFTPFWPVCLMGISLAVFLGWQVTAAARQYIASLRLADQQTVLAGQAAQAEGKLQAMMMDLLDLAKTDAEAAGIVKKYGIKFNPSPAPVAPAPDVEKKNPRTDANKEG